MNNPPALVLPAPRAQFDITMSDGAVIRVRAHGNAAGTRFVLSHGNGFAADAYLPFWSLLLERYEVVLFDFRNHGQSPYHGPMGHTYAQMAADMDRVAEGIAAELGRKVTIGMFHSLAAITSIKHALEIAWRWDALVLFDPPLIPPVDHPLFAPARAHEDKLIAWSARRKALFKNPAELAQQFARTRSHRRWVPGAHDLMARTTLRQDAAGDDWQLACPPALESSIYGANARLDLWPKPSDFGGPATLIASDPDAVDALPPGHVNRALQRELGWSCDVIADTSHLLQIEKPRAAADAMLAFLASRSVIR